MGKSKAAESERKSSARITLREFRHRLKSPGVKEQLVAHGYRAAGLPPGKRRRRKKRKLRCRSSQAAANMKFQPAKALKRSHRAPTLESVATNAIIKRLRDRKPTIQGGKEREKRFHAILGLVTSNPADRDGESSSDDTAAESTVDPRPDVVISSGSVTSSTQSSSSSEDELEVKDDHKSRSQHELASPANTKRGADGPYAECTQMQETAVFLGKGLEVDLADINQASSMAAHASYLRSLFHDSNSENGQDIVTKCRTSPCNLPPFVPDFIARETTAKPSSEKIIGFPNHGNKEAEWLDLMEENRGQDRLTREPETRTRDWFEKCRSTPADDDCAGLQALLEEAFPSDRQNYSTRKVRDSTRFADREEGGKAGSNTAFLNLSATSANGHARRTYTSPCFSDAQPQAAKTHFSTVKPTPEDTSPRVRFDVHQRLIPIDCRTPGEEDFKLLNMRAFAAIAGCSAPSPDLYGKPYSVT